MHDKYLVGTSCILEEDSDLQYLITFEHDYYGELIIDQELVKATGNIANEEQESIEESDESSNRGVSIGRRNGGRRRRRKRGRIKEVE
ncbi:hypothetical protein F8M41_016630 [Gigaspora margarita]|uniref:Uncharacterized protein n=1 Tax=Gigaspora margarita TaxID=4874 RepID=A0A8H4EML7_GIGMA|nr:hypothetical protein F8M41_016630 [Gigaspora margarita]